VAHLRCDFFSEELSLSTSMTVILPQATATQVGMVGRTATGLPPVLYLLHGLSDDDTAWLRHTSIERYVASLGVAVVMPQVHRSFYTDEALGGRYWSSAKSCRLWSRRSSAYLSGVPTPSSLACRWGVTAL
jgi:putative tributyrin esterase